MQIFRKLILALILTASGYYVSAQVKDNIQISAAFSSSIDLKVTSGSNISFTVASLKDYTDGLADVKKYNSEFEVNSSVDFKVSLTSTDFKDGRGNKLNAANFGYTIKDNGKYKVGTNHKLLGGTASPSRYAVLGTRKEIVTSTHKGNAGSAAANSYTLKFELGTANVRKVSKLPNLLDQNVAPARYASTVTLTACAMP